MTSDTQQGTAVDRAVEFLTSRHSDEVRYPGVGLWVGDIYVWASVDDRGKPSIESATRQELGAWTARAEHYAAENDLDWPPVQPGEHPDDVDWEAYLETA